MKNLIKSLDIFSSEVKLTLNKEASKYQNLFSGILGILTYVCILIFGVYF